MATELKLSDADRARFDCKEWLPLSFLEITIAELSELSDRFDFDIDDWPEPLMGEVAFEDAGNPEAKRRRPKWQLQACVWMALHQSGHMVSWDEAGALRARVTFRSTEDEELGKDEAGSKPSETSDVSTTQPSASSSA